MAVIKGNHATPGRVVAATGPHMARLAAAAASASPGSAAALEFAAMLEASGVDQPNHSFQYLTIDAQNPAADAFLPDDNPEGVIAALKALANAMVEDSKYDTEPTGVPAIYTYFGQFIDHDITAGTDRRSDEGFNSLGTDILESTLTPQAPKVVAANIVNLRLPQLDLDSVYGGEQGPQSAGVPEEGIYEDDGIHLRVGENAVVPGAITPQPELDGGGPPRRDLPRRKKGEPGVKEADIGAARIGEERNDENVILAQLQTAFLHFHNHVVQMLDDDPSLLQDPMLKGLSKFRAARQIMRWTYQWLVVEDFLRTVAQDQVVTQTLAAQDGFFSERELFMPLEFSVAGFRFGHSMVNAEYDYNENFTFGGSRGPATLVQLFQFTHGGGLGAEPGQGNRDRLINAWIIDWTRFTDRTSGATHRFARPIDTNLALPLFDMPRPIDPLQINRNLARRNLLRGYLFSIPTGQHVAAWCGVPALSSEELTPEDKPQLAKAVTAGGFDVKTPLWYYILREAEVQEQGKRLGAVGSYLVAGTLIGLLQADDRSYLNRGWDPSHVTAPKLSNGAPIGGIRDFLAFAGVMLEEEPAMVAA